MFFKIGLSKTLLLSLALFSVTLQLGQKQNPGANKPPAIQKFESSAASLKMCNGERAFCADREKNSRTSVTLTVAATDPEGDELSYSYDTTAGEILGHGAVVTWKLADTPFKTHTATVTVTDSKGAKATATVDVVVSICSSCGLYDPPCPPFTISSLETVTHRGERVTLEVSVPSVYFYSRPDYLWTIVGGKILKGQHTPLVILESTGDIGSRLSATVEIDGFDPSCWRKASIELPIRP